MLQYFFFYQISIIIFYIKFYNSFVNLTIILPFLFEKINGNRSKKNGTLYCRPHNVLTDHSHKTEGDGTGRTRLIDHLRCQIIAYTRTNTISTIRLFWLQKIWVQKPKTRKKVEKVTFFEQKSL